MQDIEEHSKSKSTKPLSTCGVIGCPHKCALEFQVSLINMAHKCYAGKVKYVDTVLEVTKRLFDDINLDK